MWILSYYSLSNITDIHSSYPQVRYLRLHFFGFNNFVTFIWVCFVPFSI